MSEPIFGFRCWALTDDRLVSTYVPYLWIKGRQVQATCAPLGGWPGSVPQERNHLSPGKECKCGYNARITAEGLSEEFPRYPSYGWTSRWLIAGAVLLFGETAWGDKVVRAEYAQPLCLSDMPRHKDVVIPDGDYQQREAAIEAVSKLYELPLVPWSKIEMYVAEFGEKAA